MYDQLRSLTYRLFNGRPQLSGLWERFGDRFAGCVMLVETTPKGLRGRITHVPAIMRQYGWCVGDVKWKDLKAGGLMAYRLRELYKEVDRETGDLNQSRFAESQLGFVGPDEIVVIPCEGGPIRSTRWCRVGGAPSE